MINIRKSADRGAVQFSWLDTKHTFSFGHYHDPNFMGFGPLRVINEDIVNAGAGFPTHAHDNMEIVTYILSGALEHKDSMGNGGVIRPGDLQRMSAGSGIKHSEYNHSATQACHLLQIWFLPAERNITPGYEQKSFDVKGRNGKLQLLASQNARENSLTINQDVDIYTALMGSNDNITHPMKEGRLGWLQVAKGPVTLNGQVLESGDGAAISGEKEIKLSGAKDAEIIFFDMVK
jgi:redox-sensitive bicupin YhaK (pirin superfamily)